MTDVINNIVDDKQDLKNQLGGTPDTIKVPFFFDGNITPLEIVTEYTKRTFDGSNNVFILNSPTYGKLGTNKLGNNASTDELYAVVPRNNVFGEYFGQNNYIDTTASTGTLNTTLETYTLAIGEVLQSEIIAKLRVPITKAKLLSNDDLQDSGGGMIIPFTLGLSQFGVDNVSIEFSNDGGTTWEEADENKELVFSTSATTDELKYRITATSASTISDPVFIQVN